MVGPDPREKELQTRRRTFNLTVVYPPTLVGEYQFRLSEWAPALAPLLTSPAHPLLQAHPAFAEGAPPPAFCPIYRIRAAADPFGCKMERADELQLPGNINSIVQQAGLVDQEVRAYRGVVAPLLTSMYVCFGCFISSPIYQTERGSQLLAMLLQEAKRREIHVEPRSLGIAKRGVCTFVQKAHSLQAAGAHLSVIVNNGERRSVSRCLSDEALCVLNWLYLSMLIFFLIFAQPTR